MTRLMVIALSAGDLVSFGIDVRLEDGQGIGWTLAGILEIEGVGRTGFECQPDPDYRLCHVYVPVDSLPASRSLVLQHFQLTEQDILQEFDH